MRLTFLLSSLASALASPLLAEQIATTDALLADVVPVVFCVDPFPPEDPDNPGMGIWSFPTNNRTTRVTTGSRIPASLGTAFGVAVRAKGPGRLEDVTVILTHPQLPDGTTQHSWVASYPAYGEGFSFYGFGRPEKMATGAWDVSLTRDDVVLYRYVFTVTPKDAASPELRYCE